MGLLSQIEQPAAAAAKSTTSAWRNVALRVLSYDVPNKITTGVDVGSGETVRIKLADPAIAGRDDVDVWSMDRFRDRKGIREKINNKAVVAGDESEAGVIIFEAVRPSKTEGLMEARWSTTAAHSALDASVFQVMARPISDKQDPNQVNPTLGIEMVRAITAAPVKNHAEIREQITNVLMQPFTQAVVRAQDEDGKVLSAVVRRPFTDELKALTKIVNAAGFAAQNANKSFGEQRAAKRAARSGLTKQFEEADANAVLVAAPTFFQADPLGRLLSKLDDAQLGMLKLEVFALEQVYPGDKYKEILNKFNGPEAPGNSVDANSFRRDWAIEGKGFGFTETYVALRQHDEGGMQVTKIRPSSTRPMLYLSLDDIPTPNIQPAATPVMGRPAPQEPEESGAAPGAEPTEPAASAAAASADAASPHNLDDISNKLAQASRQYARR